MAVAWRFFSDIGQRWHWEKSSSNGEAVQSADSYLTYSECIGAAAKHGYVFYPSQPKVSRAPWLNTHDGNRAGRHTAAEVQDARSSIASPTSGQQAY